MTPSPPPGLPDRYRYLRILGRGGFGSVWAMHDEILGRPVAVKVLEGNLDEEGAARFLREARVTAELRHPSSAPAILPKLNPPSHAEMRALMCNTHNT